MNGNRTAEQYAEAAEQYALETKQKALEIADAALKMEQAAGRMERGLDELRREFRKLQSAVAVGFANLKAHAQEPRHQLASFTEDEWEDSPTGTHKIKRMRKAEWESYQNEADAKKWRKALGLAWKIVLAAVLGALVRHFLGGH